MKKRKQRSPFRLVNSREVYKNPWIRVREDRVIRSDGKRGVFGVVVEELGGVQVVALDREGYCYLTKEYHYGVGKETIEVVAGGIEKGETPLQAAKRELREETGLASRRWKFLGTFYPLSTIMYSQQHIFIAKNAEKLKDQSEEDKKNLRVLRVPFEKAVQMAHHHAIDIAPSMVALFRAHEFLNSKESRAELKITGRVQGVFFRHGVKREAERLGLTGWARNELDGCVRVAAEGSEHDLQQLVEWCKKGTEFVKVEKVEIEWREARGNFKGFAIK